MIAIAADWTPVDHARLLTTSERTTVRKLLRTHLLLGLILHEIHHKLVTIRAAQGAQPGASTYDTPNVAGGQRSVTWCWRHERAAGECEKAELNCRGETITINDPTGEAAVRADPARRTLDQLATQTETMLRAATRIVDELARYDTRTATSRERRATRAVNDDLGCAWCATITGPKGGAPWWNPVHRTTTLAGTLPKPTPLCHACIRRHTDTGRRPTRDELMVKRDTERWPHEHVQPRRT